MIHNLASPSLYAPLTRPGNSLSLKDPFRQLWQTEATSSSIIVHFPRIWLVRELPIEKYGGAGHASRGHYQPVVRCFAPLMFSLARPQYAESVLSQHPACDEENGSFHDHHRISIQEE